MNDPSIVTFTGKAVNPLDPDPETIDIIDIAHALSRMPRFTGHCRGDHAYTVAQHSVLVSCELPPKHALTGLLHDASEAYLGDLARPIKLDKGLGAMYRMVESRLMGTIADKYGIDWPLPVRVKQADDQLLRAEVRDLMADHKLFNGLKRGKAYIRTITPWPPRMSYDMFLLRFEELTI